MIRAIRRRVRAAPCPAFEAAAIARIILPPGRPIRCPAIARPDAAAAQAAARSLGVPAMARRSTARKRTRNEKIMIVVGVLVSISMVISGFAALLQ